MRIVVDVAAAHPDSPKRNPNISRSQHFLNWEVAQVKLVLQAPVLPWFMLLRETCVTILSCLTHQQRREASPVALPIERRRQVASDIIGALAALGSAGRTYRVWIASPRPRKLPTYCLPGTCPR
jgi:hypothetical protein